MKDEEDALTAFTSSFILPPSSFSWSTGAERAHDCVAQALGRDRRRGLALLGVAPVVEDGDLVRAGHRAERRAPLLRVVLALDVGLRVLLDGDAGRAALLRAVVYESVLADVEVARAGAAAPGVGLARGEAVLEPPQARVLRLVQSLQLVVNLLLAFGQRLQKPVPVVYDADRRGEAEFDCAARDCERVFRVTDAAADDRVDVDVEVRVLGDVYELAVEVLEALLGDLVGIDVVNRNLEVLKSGVVQSSDAFGSDVIAVGDESSDHAASPYVADDLVEVRVHHRLAARNGDDGRAEVCERGESPLHHVEGHGV